MSETKKKGYNLKIDHLTSVDLCGKGANPDAHICLYKSAEGGPEPKPNEVPETKERNFLGKMYDLRKSAFEPLNESENLVPIDKEAQTFGEIRAAEEVSENLWKYTDALRQSIRSIVGDGELDANTKHIKLNETLDQFSAAMKSIFPALAGFVNKSDDTEGKEQQIDKSHKEGDDEPVELKNIDKSGLTADEQTQLDALLAKCTVKEETDPAPAVEKNTDPATPPVSDPAPVVEKKATETMDPAIAKALADVELLKKNYEEGIVKQEKAEMLGVAKKYINLGMKPEELADTLYNLKKSGEANYNAYVSALDDNLSLVEKSGLFKEIGKSLHTDGNGSDADEAWAKSENLAKSIMQEQNITKEAALEKVWEQNPDLADLCAN